VTSGKQFLRSAGRRGGRFRFDTPSDSAYRMGALRSKLSVLILCFCAAAFLASVFYLAPVLPAKVATHFGGSGQANGWMTRDGYLSFISLFGLGMPAIIIGLCHLIHFLPPALLNVPDAAYWRSPENYRRACGMIRVWSIWFGVVCLVWTACLNALTVQANLASPPHLATARLLAVTAAYLLALLVLIVGLVVAFKRAKVSHAETQSHGDSR